MLGHIYENVKVIDWQEAREDVAKVNPELAKIIDAINPDKSYKLIKVKYHYGDLIVNHGELQLPLSKNNLLPVSHTNMDASLLNLLNYSAIPLFLTLKKSHEIFLNTMDRIIPLNFCKAGTLLGLFESIDFFFKNKSEPRWNISAGARSLFMLPKISDMQGLKRLRDYYEFDYSMLRPIDLADHWKIFKDIATHLAFDQVWESEVLIFSKSWLDKQQASSEWSAFHFYLFKQAWQQTQFAMSKIESSLMWEIFLKKITLRRLNPTPYLANQIKHIMLIADGKIPAFQPMDESQEAAPSEGLKEVFLNVYLLKQYSPTLMYPQLLKPALGLPVYYSLMFPTLLEGSPCKKSSSTVMLDLRTLDLLLNILLESAFDHSSFVKTNMLQTNFTCFHVENDRHGIIQPSDLIAKEDSIFLQKQKKDSDRIFCSSSPFWRGSVRIKYNQLLSS